MTVSAPQPLRDTLLAYVACDLDVGATARRLGLHANTVHYRLRRRPQAEAELWEGIVASVIQS